MRYTLQILPTKDVRKVGQGNGEHFAITDSCCAWQAKAAHSEQGEKLLVLPHALHGIANRTVRPAQILVTASYCAG
jgi:hypothetical protein